MRVESENVRSGEVLHTSTAYLTMVALDDEGNPTEVPPLAPETPDEIRRAREAQLRRDTRLAERQRIEQERTALGLDGAAPAASGSWSHSVNLPLRIV